LETVSGGLELAGGQSVPAVEKRRRRRNQQDKGQKNREKGHTHGGILAKKHMSNAKQNLFHRQDAKFAKWTKAHLGLKQ
jgi:hypothetical protein